RGPLDETLPGIERIAGEAAAALDASGVVVEVGVAAANGAPVEQPLVFHIRELVEHAVQRFRLARPGAEDPSDAISQPVGMAGPTAAPGVFGHLAAKITRNDVAYGGPEEVVVGDPEGSEEGQLSNENSMVEAARGRRRAGGNIEL